MRQDLIDAFNEIHNTEFTTLEEIKRSYSKADIVGAWLQYEGIIGYTSRILRVVELQFKGIIVHLAMKE